MPPCWPPRSGPAPGDPDYEQWCRVWEQYFWRAARDPMTPKPVHHLVRGWEIHEPERLPETDEARRARALGALTGIADLTTKGAASRPPTRAELEAAGARAVAAVKRKLAAAAQAATGRGQAPPQGSLTV